MGDGRVNLAKNWNGCAYYVLNRERIIERHRL